MIEIFTNLDGDEIGINPEHVVAVESKLACSEEKATIIHLATGQQRGVAGALRDVIEKLNVAG